MILLTIQPQDNFQSYLNLAQTAGGGVVNLNPTSTFYPTSDIIVPSNVTINFNGATVDFNHQAYGFKVTGVNVYSTGTLTSITSGVNVVGSGTVWKSNITPFVDQLFVNGQWMIIASVTDNTHLTLLEGYDGPTVSGSSYIIGIPSQNVTFNQCTIQNSTATAIKIDYARFQTINNVALVNNNAGMVHTYVTEFQINEITPTGCTLDGIKITNGGRYNWSSVNSVNNGGNGILLSGIRSMGISQGALSSNVSAGCSLTNCSDVDLFDFDANVNGTYGIVGVSGNSNITLITPMIRANTSDGVQFSASCNNCKITTGDFENNGGYGINIADNTSNNNIIGFNTFVSNSSGAVHNSGTGTLIRSNIGVADN